jgi:hypothetical protein
MSAGILPAALGPLQSAFSSGKECLMLKKGLGLLFAVFIAAGLLFTGCPQPTDDEHDPLDDLIGNWRSEYDGYNITSTTVTYDDGGYGYDWAGIIEYVKDFKESGEEGTSGLVIIRYTGTGSSLSPNYQNGYQGFYYKGDPDEGSLQFANATPKNYSAVDTETLADAKKAFTGTGYYSSFIRSWESTPYNKE